MTSTAVPIRQIPWFQTRKWYTDIHFDKDNQQEICKTHPIYQELIDKLAQDDVNLLKEDTDWAFHLRTVAGLPPNMSDFARKMKPESISRAVKTLLAYRALDIICYVLELAPERKLPLPLTKPVHGCSAFDILDVTGNWAQDILELEELLEAHWKSQPSPAASSSSTILVPSTYTPPGINTPKEKVIQSMQQSIDISISGRGDEKLHRFLASFHEVSAIMGYIISHGTTHLPNLPPELLAHRGKPIKYDVTLSYILSASATPIMLFMKHTPNMRNPHKYIDLWTNTVYDDSFRVVDKALWTAIVHVMMGNCDAKTALHRFFNESREILNSVKAEHVSASPKRKKRKLPTEDIDHVEISSKKKNKHDAPEVCHSSDLLNKAASFSLHQMDQPTSQGAQEYSAGQGASMTTAKPVAESQDPQGASNPQNVMNGLDKPASPDSPIAMVMLVRDSQHAPHPPNISQASMIALDHPMVYPPNATGLPMPDAQDAPATSHGNEPSSLANEHMDFNLPRAPVVDLDQGMSGQSPPPSPMTPIPDTPPPSGPTTTLTLSTHDTDPHPPPNSKTVTPPSPTTLAKKNPVGNLLQSNSTTSTSTNKKELPTKKTPPSQSSSSKVPPKKAHSSTNPSKSRSDPLPMKTMDVSAKKSHPSKPSEMTPATENSDGPTSSEPSSKTSAAKGIYWGPTELEDWPKIEDLDAMESYNVVFAPEFVSYPITGSETTQRYRSAGHTADANTWFENLYKRSDVIKVAPTANQSVTLYDREAFESFNDSQLQRAFGLCHILITDKTYKHPKFDKARLVKILGSETKPFPIIDHSDPPKKIVYKTVKDLLDQVKSEDGSLKEAGRIFTILKTETADGPHPDPRIATDIQAFCATVDRPLCHGEKLPLSGNRWATITTPHAIQEYQYSSLGTFIFLEIGYLFLFIAKSDAHQEVSLATKPFHQQDFQVVLLAPGSTIYIRPGTLCYSVSSTACAIRGGHFISSSTLRMTAVATFKSFDMFSKHTTSSHEMIRYIVTMFHANWVIGDEEEHLMDHLPKPQTFDGMVDIFHICAIADMGAVLYVPRYQGEAINYSDKHKKSFIRCCELAKEIKQYLFSSYKLTTNSGKRKHPEQIYYHFLVLQVQAFLLQQAKIPPSSDNRQTVANHLDLIAEAIARCFYGDETFWNVWDNRSQNKDQSLVKYGFFKKKFTLLRREEKSYEGKKTSVEEECNNDPLDSDIATRVAQLKGWAKT